VLVKTEDELGGTPSGPATDGGSASGSTGVLAPKATGHLVELPESLGYRIKSRILGPPINTDRLAHERLGKPTALAVFASDNLSSSAYATEEILRVLIPAIGVFAFAMVVPITIAMLVVLGFLILSYRQTIKEYPSAGGAYIVTRDNFGIFWAQIAGVSLLTDYVLTVAVSTAAGAAALASAFDVFEPFILPIAIVFVCIVAGGNLKGVKESGKAFAIPTYFFIVNMIILLVWGVGKYLTGNLPQAQDACTVAGAVPCGQGVDGLLFFGTTLFVVLHAFASGGAAVTGVEAISNGVPAFKEPAWRNARSTLVVMGSLLGVMFLGLSFLAAQVHAVPFESGTPTVISQVGDFIYGHSGLGIVLFYSLQAGTMLILVLAANTSFADFPRLASFQASDNFMPRQLVKRGHRLVFSNGIITLSVAAIVLLLVTGAKVERLIPMYAIGVFTSFTLSQSGMAKHHVKKREPGWQRGLLINAIGAVLSFVVLIIFAVTKFKEGAWVIIVLIPILVAPLFRLNKQYAEEHKELQEDAHDAAEQAILGRHVVFVLIDDLDMAAARAIQYARTLVPDELTAIHFDLDPLRTQELTGGWSTLGFARLSLDIIECPDRRIERAAAEVVAREVARGDTEVTVLLPRREYSRFWHQLVHDRTADSIAKVLDDIPHCNVTIVPYHLGTRGATPKIITPVEQTLTAGTKTKGRGKTKEPQRIDIGDFDMPADRIPIRDAQFRQRVQVAGKVYSMRVQPWSGVAALELTVIDDTGAIAVVFFGRRQLAGVNAGSKLVIEGVVGEHRGKMAMLNPAYNIQADAGAET
jgi:amino acid transporter